MAAASDRHASPGRLPRLLAALVCALALGLLAWRGAAILTGPAPAAATAADAALADLLAPVAGAGLTRLSVTDNAEGGRTVLILLDQSAAARRPELERIAPLAAGLVAERGDQLVIETVGFAAGMPGRPDAAAWLELGGLAAICLLAAALTLWPARALPAPTLQVISAPAAAPPEPVASAPRAVRAVPVPMPADAAGDLARRDPARAAAVVRGWMRSTDELT